MRPRSRDDVARSAVVLAIGAVVAFVAFLLLKRVWRDLDCGDDHTIVLDAVITTMALLAGASVLVGLVAIVTRTRMRWSIVTVLVGCVLLVLLVLPSTSLRIHLTSYNCGVDVT